MRRSRLQVSRSRDTGIRSDHGRRRELRAATCLQRARMGKRHLSSRASSDIRLLRSDRAGRRANHARLRARHESIGPRRGRGLGRGHHVDSEKLGAVTGTDESPVIVSRNTSTESGDSVVTTIYAVSNGTVTLIERSSARDALRRQKPKAGFSDQLMAKARDDIAHQQHHLVRFVRAHAHVARCGSAPGARAHPHRALRR